MKWLLPALAILTFSFECIAQSEMLLTSCATKPGKTKGIDEGRMNDFDIFNYSANVLTGTENQPIGIWNCAITSGGMDAFASFVEEFLAPTHKAFPMNSGEQNISMQFSQYTMKHRPNLKLGRKISFSGFDWFVKQSDELTGPGNNYFSGHPSDVWVDELHDELHLKIVHRDGRWYSTEVVADTSLGYGTYIFEIQSPVNSLVDDAVLGMFIYEENSSHPARKEMDIEISRWSDLMDVNNAQFVVQPCPPDSNRLRFFIEEDSPTTHIIHWTKNQVKFQSINNHCSNGKTVDEIASWVYNNQENIPIPAYENPRINFWLNKTIPPYIGELEIVISNFDFIP